MNWRLSLVAILILWSTAVAARHGSGVLDPRRATPGIRIALEELTQGARPGTKGYRLRAEGMPRDVVYEVWAKDFGQQFTRVFSGFRFDETGELASTDGSAKPRRLGDFVFDPGPYPDGAVWMVALASEDHQLSAFAKVIPHPIVARDGACTVTLELISLHGNRFVASGEGFKPGEEVDIEMRSSGRLIQKKQRTSPEGFLPLDVVSHGAISTDYSARYTVKAASCAPDVRYSWGEAALVRH